MAAEQAAKEAEEERARLEAEKAAAEEAARVAAEQAAKEAEEARVAAEKAAELGLHGVEVVKIPEGEFDEIGEAAFKGQTQIKEIFVPQGITKAQKHAFDGCKSGRPEICRSSSSALVTNATAKSAEVLARPTKCIHRRTTRKAATSTARGHRAREAPSSAAMVMLRAG